jgi:hypothetical protein
VLISTPNPALAVVLIPTRLPVTNNQLFADNDPFIKTLCDKGNTLLDVVAYEALFVAVAKLAVPINCGAVMLPVEVRLPEIVDAPWEISPFFTINSFAILSFPYPRLLFANKYQE